jgi:hypothetical protein
MEFTEMSCIHSLVSEHPVDAEIFLGSEAALLLGQSNDNNTEPHIFRPEGEGGRSEQRDIYRYNIWAEMAVV